MKKLLFLLLLCLPLTARAEFTAAQIAEFHGWVDIIEPDLLQEGYSPDLLNVRTDLFASLLKREGYSSFLNPALPDLQQVRTIYPYSQQNGNKYIIIESSSSLYYSLGDGITTSLLTSQNPAYRYSFATAKDYLYGSNGYNDVIRSSVTTGFVTTYSVANSTGYVKARYMVWWMNKMFFAGIDGQMSTIWWSEYLDPMNIQNTTNKPNFMNINVQDGDVITGLYVTSDNKLKVFKTYSSWEVFSTGVGADGYAGYDFRNLSQKIGCLYGTTIDELNGFPTWLGQLGVYQYDGNFNLLSAPIDKFMKSLRQLRFGSQVLTQDTAADWGAGSGVNIDTTTYSGSVAFQSQVNTHNNEPRRTRIVPPGDSVTQKIIPNQTIFISSCTGGTSVGTVSSSFHDTHTLSLLDANNVVLSSRIFETAGSNLPLFYNNTLYAGATYYIQSVLTTVAGGGKRMIISDSSSTISGISVIMSTVSANNGYLLCELTVINSSASHTTQSLNATDASSWGSFSVQDTKPSGSAINYYAVTSTSVYNLSTNTAFPLTNGSPVNSTVVPYIKVISSFTRTDATAIPMLNSFNIVCYATDTNYPIGKVYDGRYYLFVSTDNTTKINNVALCYQKSGDWTLFNNIYANSACLYKDDLYTGSSNSKGQVYKMFVDGIYSDAGNSYDAYWCSKVYDHGVFANFKTFDSMWLSARNSGNWDINVDYRLDGTGNNWTSKSLSLYSTNLYIVGKIPFAMDEPRSGRYIQYRLRNSNAGESFRIKKLQTVFEIEPAL